MPDRSINERVRAILCIEDHCQRLEALGELREKAPAEMLEALVPLLIAPEQNIRRRAGSALSLLKMGGVNLEPKADALASHLQHNQDERVRLSCAGVLMSMPGPAVDRAYLRALADPFNKVALIACLELGYRCGTEGTAALFGTLTHPVWRVRLEACKALITQETADQRVVTTLEAMSREPDAVVYDRQVDQFKEFAEECSQAFGPDANFGEMWGKLDTILARAHAVAITRPPIH